MAEVRNVGPLDVDGPAAPPRRNGELIFAAPWESRLFGLTMSLHRRGLFEWEEFRQLLIAEIRAWDQGDRPGREWSYYERWRAALERLLESKGLCESADLDSRMRNLAARPRGHDH